MNGFGMKSAFNRKLIPVILAGVVIALLGIGFFAGRYSAVRPFEKKIHSYSRGETLGKLLSDKEKRGVAKAYYDKDEVMEKMDTFSWAVPNVPAPFVGSAPKPGKHHNATINSLHFRAEAELTIPKPPRVYRIFITGGSTAYGSGAPGQDRTIGGYLGKILNTSLSPATGMRYEVLTMANPAWASTHERIVIENRLSELEPDLVASFSGNNDVHWAQKGRNILWFRSYADQFFLSLINRAYRVSGHEEIVEMTDKDPPPVPPALVATRLVKNVKLCSHALSNDGIPYFFFLQPSLALTKKRLTGREQELVEYRKKKHKGERKYFAKCHAHMESCLKELKMDDFYFFDLSGIFDDMGEGEDVFIDSYHFGDKGNELVAKSIFRHIRNVIEQ